MPLLVQCVAFKESSLPNENIEGNLWRLNHALQKTSQQSLLGVWRSRGWVLCAFPLSSSAPHIEQTQPSRDVVLKLVSCVKELHDRLICVWPRGLLESIILLNNNGTIRLSGTGVFQATNRVEFRPDKDLHSLIEICQRAGLIEADDAGQVNSVKELENRLRNRDARADDFNPYPDEKTSDSLLLLSWCHSVIHYQLEEMIADAVIQQRIPNGDSSFVFKSIELLSKVMTLSSSTERSVEYREAIVDLETRRLVADLKREKKQQPQKHQKKAQKRKQSCSKEAAVGSKKSTAQQQTQEQVLPGGQLTMALTAFLMRAAGGASDTRPTASTTESFDSPTESEGITDGDEGNEDNDREDLMMTEPIEGIEARLQSLHSSLVAMEHISEPQSESFETICSSSPCTKQFLIQCDEYLSTFGGFPRSLRRRLWAMIAMIRMETPFREILLHEYELAKTEVEESRQSSDAMTKDSNEREELGYSGAHQMGSIQRSKVEAEEIRQSDDAMTKDSNEREELGYSGAHQMGSIQRSKVQAEEIRQSSDAMTKDSNEREELGYSGAHQMGSIQRSKVQAEEIRQSDDAMTKERIKVEEMRESSQRTKVEDIAQSDESVQVEMWNPFATATTTREETTEVSNTSMEPTTEELLTNSDNQETTPTTTSLVNELNPIHLVSDRITSNRDKEASLRDPFSRLRQLEYQLDKDLPRCHRYHPGVISSCDTIQSMLTAWQMTSLVDLQKRNSIDAAANLQPSLERTYWQGLDSVCAVFLMVMELNETESFAILRLWTDTVMKGEVYVVDPALRGIKHLERGVMEELGLVDPELFRHLIKDLEMDPKWFLLPWVLAGFAHGVLPIGDALFKLFDWFILGKTTVTDFSLAVLIQTRRVLLKLSDAGDVKLFLSRLPAISPDALVNEGLGICEYKSRLLFPFEMPRPTTTGLRLVEETNHHRRFAKLVSGSFFFSNDEIKRSTMLVARRGDKSPLSTLDLSGCALTFMDDSLFAIESFDRMRDGKLVVQSLMKGEHHLKERKCIGIVSIGMDGDSVEFAFELWELLVVYHSVAHVFIIVDETEPQGPIA